MSTQPTVFSLADWRRQIAGLYATVRDTPRDEWRAARREFRDVRDRLFAEHPQTPLSAADRERFEGLRYYPYDPSYRVSATLDHDVDEETFEVQLRDDGEFRYRRVARARFDLDGSSYALPVYWVEGYGGGLFVPFGDRSNGDGTYGGGRYLYDTIKGADLGAGTDGLPLDFNFAYNPSCVYDDRWHCPLPPSESDVPVRVEAGERATFATTDDAEPAPEPATD